MTNAELRALLAKQAADAHALAGGADAALAAFDGLTVTPPPPPVDPPPSTTLIPPAPTGGDDTQMLQAFLDAHPTGTVTFDPTRTYVCNRELALKGQTVVGAHTQAGPEGAGIGGAHPYRNIYMWNCPPGSAASLRDCVHVGRNVNTTAGDAPGNAYDAEREAQHFINAEGVASLSVRNCKASKIWGDGLFCGPGAGNVPCKGVDVDGLDVSLTGRQGLALTGIDGGMFRHVNLHHLRRSATDVEPLGTTDPATEYGMVKHVTFEDCSFGPSRLLPLAGEGREMEVVDVTWRRCKNVAPTGTPILKLGASDYKPGTGMARRGPFLMEDCTWDVGGSAAPGFSLVGIDGFTFRRTTAKFPTSRAMTAVTLVDSVNVVVEGCSFPGASVRVRGDASSTWHDDGATVTPPPPPPVDPPPPPPPPVDPPPVVMPPPPVVGGDGGGTPNAAPDGTKDASNGVSFTYHGPDWVFVNFTSSPALANFQRPGYSVFSANLSGDAATLVADMARCLAAVEAMVAKYKLHSRGIFVGHSSSAALLQKAIKGEGDIVVGAKLLDRFWGVGFSGVAYRCSDKVTYTNGGHPMGHWPANIRKVWYFSGIQHPVMVQAIGGADEVPGGSMSMTLAEAFAWAARSMGLPLPAGYIPVVPATITAPVVFDTKDATHHARMVVTDGEGHVIVSTKIDTDADFWLTMLT